MHIACPNCNEPVSFLRSIRISAIGSFRCTACGSILSVSLGRRLLAAAAWLVLEVVLTEGLRLYQWGRLVGYGQMLVTLPLMLYVFEKITLVERRAFTCKACGYDLQGLPENRCPECGQEFDPAEREQILARIHAPPPKPPQRLIAILLVVVLALLVATSFVVWRRATPTPPPATKPATQPATASAAPFGENRVRNPAGRLSALLEYRPKDRAPGLV